MRRILIFIIGILSVADSLFAREFPFTDVRTTDSFYEGVRDLYTYGIISDDGTHLFRPNDAVSRDMFVGLATSVSCKKCLTPSIDDILNYYSSPFIDLKKINPYYYCIAYANEENIVQGYTLGSDGMAQCENGEKYSSVPFCESNKTTRIESVAMLLRQAALWNDTKNTNYTAKIQISDISSYWQGYAEKGIQAGILKLDAENRIYPDTSISRGEFAFMAGKMLAFNQCAPGNKGTYSTYSAIGIRDASGKNVNESTLSLGRGISLIPLTSSGTWEYSWKATHTSTQNTLNSTGSTFPIDSLSPGTWIVELSIIDKESGEIVSRTSMTITIEGEGSAPYSTTPEDGRNGSGSSISVILQSDDSTKNIHEAMNFSSSVEGGVSTLTYIWDYGDGSRISGSGNTSHTYDEPGIYTVILTVTDTDGNTSQSQIVIEIGGDSDSDGDGTNDDVDICIFVQGSSENNGCPIIAGKGYGDIVSNILSNEMGSIMNDTDNDGINDGEDYCIEASGSLLYHGCPEYSPLENLSANQCLGEQLNSRGIIIASPVCLTCPCENNINMLSLARTCDILFPAILSQDKKNLYSRGDFYQIH